MSHKFIPYGRQSIDEEDIKSVVETLKSDFLTTGPKIEEFEEKLAKYVGCKYAVAVANGTAALHSACFALDLQPNDEVITTPMTFAATANSIIYSGGKPVFADIDPKTYNIDPLDVEKKITSNTKAILAVDYTGQPAQLFTLKEIAKNYNLMLIEDAAHSLGALIRDPKGEWKKTGSISDITIFSFHPVKQITTGEGGVICTNNESIYKKILQFRTHGITRDAKLLKKANMGDWYYEQQFLGYNYRLTDIQAALGISQLRKLDRFIKRRVEIANKYNYEFSAHSYKGKLTIPYQTKNTKSSCHIYILKFNTLRIGKTRKEIFNRLRDKNIGVNVHYIPVYYHPYYEKLGYKKGICIEAEKLYEEIITLPIHPSMTEEDVDYVVKCVKEIIKD